MKIILISGKNGTGKSEVCKEIFDLLQKKLNSSNIDKQEQNGEDNKDYIEILSGKDKQNKPVKILLNFASDNDDTIDKLKDWIKNQGPFDIVITAIRTKGKLKSDIMDILNISPSDTILTLRLEKVEYSNPQANDLNKIIKKYQIGILNTVEECLKNSTFSLF